MCYTFIQMLIYSGGGDRERAHSKHVSVRARHMGNNEDSSFAWNDVILNYKNDITLPFNGVTLLHLFL